MIKIVEEIYDIREIEFWSGGKDTFEKLEEQDLIDELQEFIENMDDESWTITELNDFLWFEEDYILESLGLEIEE